MTVGTGPIGLVLALNDLIIKKISVLTPVDYGSPDNVRGKEVFFKCLIPCKVITLYT